LDALGRQDTSWSVNTVQKSNQGSLLVVDDDKQVCQAMADYLRSLGHRTETAFTCLDAIERMGEFPFQVVLCDVCLQDADGFTSCNGPSNTPPIPT
jgi:CheY-like chemotaxis protein